MKKFQNLGIILGREQSKKIKGGDECLDCEDGIKPICKSCNSDSDCDYNRVCRSSPSCSDPKVCAKILWV